MDNKLFELAARRRSVRKYASKKIDDTVMDEIMKVALMAPASFGHQPVEFVIVRDQQAIRDIASCKKLGGSQIIGADAVIVVMVMEFPNRELLNEYLAEEPYVIERVWEKVEVEAINVVIVNDEKVGKSALLSPLCHLEGNYKDAARPTFPE